MKRLVLKSENLLVDVVSEIEIGGVMRYRVRDANNAKAEIRTFLSYALREPTEEELEPDHIVYLYTDEETGEEKTLKLKKAFIKSVPAFLEIGRGTALTAKEVMDKLAQPDTDSNRRQFRAACAYWIEKGLVVVSTSNGYFIAGSAEEVESCVKNKERQANANLKRAALLKSMDITSSITLFQSTK
jgi:hypothetical protein